MKHYFLQFNMCTWKKKGTELKIAMQTRHDRAKLPGQSLSKRLEPNMPTSNKTFCSTWVPQPQPLASPPLWEDGAKGEWVVFLSVFALENIQRTKLAAIFLSLRETDRKIKTRAKTDVVMLTLSRKFTFQNKARMTEGACALWWWRVDSEGPDETLTLNHHHGYN